MGRLLLAVLIACAASGCIDWGSLYEGNDGGPADAAEEHDATPNPVGCSDGTAETLLADRGLAACAGAWTVPGVVPETGPSCERAAGNDGRNASGEGCAVADLCAIGWHVCRDAGDVSGHGGDAACTELAPPSPDNPAPFIYVTRQGGSPEDPTRCDPDGTAEGADDVWGCGTLGLEAGECPPLDRRLALEGDGGGCGEPFDCGLDSSAEGRNVTKRDPTTGGGVLCCSDDLP